MEDGSGTALLSHYALDDGNLEEETTPQSSALALPQQKRSRRSSSLIKNGMLKNGAEGPLHQPTVKMDTGGLASCFCIPCGDTNFSGLKDLVLALDHFPHLGRDDSLEVNILTYNLFIRPPGIKNNADDFKEERLDEFIKVMDQFDVIGLQEMFSSFSSRVQKLIDAAHRKGFYYSLKSLAHPTLSTFLVDGGLLLLSKYPIVDDDGIIFTQGVQSDGLASKGVVYAKIQVAPSPDSCFHIFLTHTQASYLDGDPVAAKRSTDMRNLQLKELKQFMEKKLFSGHNCAGPDQPAVIRKLPGILLGDLNVNGRHEPGSDDDSDEYRTMMNILHSDHYTIKDLLRDEMGRQAITFGDVVMTEKGFEPLETVLTCKEDWGSRQRLDYIFLVTPHELERDPSSLIFDIKPHSTKVEPFYIDRHPFTQLSDHYGISTKLRYNKYTPPTSASGPAKHLTSLISFFTHEQPEEESSHLQNGQLSFNSQENNHYDHSSFNQHHHQQQQQHYSSTNSNNTLNVPRPAT